MSYNVKTIPHFDKEFKRLSKKYHSLKQEFITLVQQLKEEPEMGTPLGNNCYKIRLAIASKNKGKSGGARVITYVYTHQNAVYLLTIFDKGNRENISDKDLETLLRYIP